MKSHSKPTQRIVHGYGRGSTRKQVKTLEAQEEDCQNRLSHEI